MDDIIGGRWSKIVSLLYRIIPNPSGQDQIENHFCPHAVQTFLLLSVPKIGIWLGLVPVLMALYKELVEDGHWRNFFDKNDGTASGGADGRCDLFFRLLGSLVAYATLIWR